MKKPQTVRGMNKEEFFWSRNNCTLARCFEGWVPMTNEELEYDWKEGLLYERYRAAKEKDKPQRQAEYEEYFRNNPNRARD
jgi:hypothetical protein